MNKPRRIQYVSLFLMRVTLINIMLTLFTVAMVHAIDLEAQEILDRKVTINVVEVEVLDVLGLLSKQAKVKFTYNPLQVPIHNRVSVSVVDGKLSDVLNKVLNEIDYKVVGKQIVLKPIQNQTGSSTTSPSAENAYSMVVTGKVTDTRGDALPGVNVVIKGLTIGTTTNADGNYTIEVPRGDETLVFSFIGFLTEEILVSNQTAINVTLVEDIQSLSEIVVVGYGTQEKKEVASAISQISGSEILKSQAVSIDNSFAGRLPGVLVNQRNGEPGSDQATILIRGLSTLGNASALIVIDGVANRDGISRLDPHDIETVTVLKDASAAIYGAQSANGVILITTKRGKLGKPSISYSFNQGYVNPTRVPKMLGAADYARQVNLLTPTYSDQEIADYASGKTPSTDWVKEGLKSYSLQQRHNITLGGGTDVVKYFLSGGTAFQNGILKGDNTTEFRQYNFRANLDAQVTSRLSIGLDVTGRKENKTLLPLDPNPLNVQNTVWSSLLLSAPTLEATINGLPTAGRFQNNPLAIAKAPGYDKNDASILNGTVKASYKIPYIEGLSVDGFAAYDFRSDFRKIWRVPHTYYEKDADGNVVPVKTTNLTTKLEERYFRSASVTLHGKLRYDKIIGDHNISAFVAYEQNQLNSDNFLAARSTYNSIKIDQFFAGESSNQTNNGGAIQTARRNYFGRLAYSLKEKYLLQANFRYDGSNNFPSIKRYGFFPGVSVGWRLSEESFLQGNAVVSNLKLRGSWGRLGNDRIDPFQYLLLYQYGSGYVVDGKDVSSLQLNKVANLGATWETKDVIDIGIESSFFNNSITLEFDYFSEKRYNILTAYNGIVPEYAGISGNLPDLNQGKMNNKGFDGSILYRASVNQLNLSFGGNITYAKNKVVYISEDKLIPGWQKIEGKPLGNLNNDPKEDLAYQVIGIYRTQDDLTKFAANSLSGTPKLGDAIYKDYDGDGKITVNDRYRPTLTNTPRLQYGINFGAQYKGFDLTILFQGQAKSIQYLTYNFSAASNGTEYFTKNAWTAENPNASLPAVNRSLERNSLWLRNTSFLRLKNIELGYSLPKSLISRAGIQALRFYINGFNVLTFDGLKKDKLTDPEGISIQGYNYPQTKSYNVGLNVTL